MSLLLYNTTKTSNPLLQQHIMVHQTCNAKQHFITQPFSDAENEVTYTDPLPTSSAKQLGAPNICNYRSIILGPIKVFPKFLYW